MATLPKAKPSVISVSNLHMPFHIPGEASKRPTHNNSQVQENRKFRLALPLRQRWGNKFYEGALDHPIVFFGLSSQLTVSSTTPYIYLYIPFLDQCVITQQPIYIFPQLLLLLLQPLSTLVPWHTLVAIRKLKLSFHNAISITPSPF